MTFSPKPHWYYSPHHHHWPHHYRMPGPSRFLWFVIGAATATVWHCKSKVEGRSRWAHCETVRVLDGSYPTEHMRRDKDATDDAGEMVETRQWGSRHWSNTPRLPHPRRDAEEISPPWQSDVAEEILADVTRKTSEAVCCFWRSIFAVSIVLMQKLIADSTHENTSRVQCREFELDCEFADTDERFHLQKLEEREAQRKEMERKREEERHTPPPAV